MNRKFLISITFFALFALALHAQSADSVSRMISTQKGSFGQVSYFSATALGLVNDSASNEEAFNALKKAGIISADTSDTVLSVIHLDELALILAKTWKINNSLMYKIMPSKRYAFNMLRADGIFERNADPNTIPTGREVLNLINSTIEKAASFKGAK